MICVPDLLPRYLLGWFVREVVARSDLPVRMRIGAAHEFALVLEYLNPAPPLAEFPDLTRPSIDNVADLGHRHVCKSQVVAR